jgi:hypothetical protein
MDPSTFQKVYDQFNIQATLCNGKELRPPADPTVIANGHLIPPFLLASIIPIAIAISPLPFNSQNRIIWTSEMRMERVPKLVQFWDPFLKGFGPQNGPQNGSGPPKLFYLSLVLWMGNSYCTWRGGGHRVL